MAVSTFAAEAQVNLVEPNGSFTAGTGGVHYTTLDTLEDSETKTHYVQVPNRWQYVNFQTNMTDITGDPSGVTVAIYNALDTTGGRYDSIPLFTDTMANANTTRVREVEGNPCSHYKIVITGAGTHTSSYQVKLTVR